MERERCRYARIEELGLPSKGVSGEEHRIAVGMVKWVFDGGGDEPPSRCGRLARDESGSAGRVDRRHCNDGDCGASWEEEGGGVTP